ncbi:MAG: hypothetical protein Q8N51_00860 [Gammaproteobacteria bacterium]|nr:hypothetical protein [Gammaproteobacteria bacterium]
MSETCETVTIVGADSAPLVINKEDFDPKAHKLFEAKAEKKDAKAEKKAD